MFEVMFDGFAVAEGASFLVEAAVGFVMSVLVDLMVAVGLDRLPVELPFVLVGVEILTAL